MNERVKAILLTALKLSPEEREELAQSLLNYRDADPAEAEQLLGAADALGGAGSEAPQQPTTDVLAKYLDI